MEENKFEKRVKQKMDEFAVQPSEVETIKACINFIISVFMYWIVRGLLALE